MNVGFWGQLPAMELRFLGSALPFYNLSRWCVHAIPSHAGLILFSFLFVAAASKTQSIREYSDVHSIDRLSHYSSQTHSANNRLSNSATQHFTLGSFCFRCCFCSCWYSGYFFFDCNYDCKIKESERKRNIKQRRRRRRRRAQRQSTQI